MKISILTFHRPINYGAFLQAFALKSYLTSLGHDVFFVDYWPEEHEEMYKIFSKKEFNNRSFIQKVRYLVSVSLTYRRKSILARKMYSLQYKHLGITPNVSYRNGKQLEDLKCDCLIYGSDQIWWKDRLPNFSGFDWTYWGDYVNKNIRKVAYAPSMGIINLTDEDKTNISTRIESFYSLSVREQELKNVIKGLTKHNIQVACDPTFLFTKDAWTEYIKPVPTPKHYLLLFNLTRAKETKELAKQKAKRLNLPIIEVNSSVSYLDFNILHSDAFEFLYLIKNADFVVTSSFHGTAFSVIFEKQFFSLGMKNNSSRVASLLNILGISERLILNNDTIDNKQIDYNIVTPKLNNYISKSKEFIIDSVQ